MIAPGDIVVLGTGRHAFARPTLVLAACEPNSGPFQGRVVQRCFVVDCGSSELAGKIRWTHVLTTVNQTGKDEVQISHECAS